MTHDTEVLAGLVDTAYRQFSTPAPRSLHLCTACCMPPETERAMLRQGPRAWTAAQMEEWYGAAAANPYPHDVARYVLPRALDGMVRGENASLSPEVSLQRFDIGSEALWSTADRALLDQFMALYLRQVMMDLTRETLDEALCLFVLGGWAPEPLFDLVLECPLGPLVQRLHQDWVTDPRPGPSRFWPDVAVPQAFYQGAALQERLDEALAVLEDTAFDQAVQVWEAQAQMRRHGV